MNQELVQLLECIRTDPQAAVARLKSILESPTKHGLTEEQASQYRRSFNQAFTTGWDGVPAASSAAAARVALDMLLAEWGMGVGRRCDEADIETLGNLMSEDEAEVRYPVEAKPAIEEAAKWGYSVTLLEAHWRFRPGDRVVVTADVTHGLQGIPPDAVGEITRVRGEGIYDVIFPEIPAPGTGDPVELTLPAEDLDFADMPEPDHAELVPDAPDAPDVPGESPEIGHAEREREQDRAYEELGEIWRDFETPW